MKATTTFLLAAATVFSAAGQDFELVKDINPTSGSNPQYLTDYNGKLYFNAYDNEHELWVTDGTEAGTQKVKDINPTGGSSPGGMTKYNGKLYFVANDGTHGRELWVTDGTEAGTQMIKDINSISNRSSSPDYFTVYNGSLYFGASDSNGDAGVWKTDGTTAGTQMVKMVNPSESYYKPRNFTEHNGKLYFVVLKNGGWTAELWTTDGTTAGTQMFKTITSTSIIAFDVNNSFTKYSGKLYFGASEGDSSHKLWESDGTANGTIQFKDLNASWLTEYKGKLYFRGRDDNNSVGLWVSDGSQSGTQILYNDVSPLGDFTEFKGELYFGSKETNGAGELWKTDGTTAGTQRIKVIDSISGHTDFLTVYNGKLYFKGRDNTNGYELWESDGTEVGTITIQPAVSPNSDPLEDANKFEESGGALYFLADFNSYSEELWKLTTCPQASELSVTNISVDAADISWTEGGSASEWEIVYGPSDFDINTEGTSVSDTDGTMGITLRNLSSNTSYDVYVRAICSPTMKSEWSAVETFTTKGLSVSEMSYTHFTIHPNPVKDQLKFDFQPAIPSEVSLYNLQGKNMGNYSIENGATINISHLPPGIYLLKIKTSGETMKIMKH